jgi:recombination protein RecA
VAEFDIMFGTGISREGDVLDISQELEIVEKRGSFYYYQGERFAQGREYAKQYLQENPEFTDKIEQAIRDQMSTLGSLPLKVGVGAADEDYEGGKEEFSE